MSFFSRAFSGLFCFPPQRKNARKRASHLGRSALAAAVLIGALAGFSGCVATPEDIAAERAEVSEISPHFDFIGPLTPVCSRADWQSINDQRELARRNYEAAVASAEKRCRPDCLEEYRCCLCAYDSCRRISPGDGCVSRGEAACEAEFGRCATQSASRDCINAEREAAAVEACNENYAANVRRAFCLQTVFSPFPRVGATFPWTDTDGNARAVYCDAPIF